MLALKSHRESDVSPKVPQGDGKRILTEQQELLVIGLLLDAPTLYLSEVCQMVLRITGVQVSPPTICRIIHRNGRLHQAGLLAVLEIYLRDATYNHHATYNHQG